MASQEGVGRGGEEVKIFTTFGHLAHTRTKFCRGNVPEYFENADEVIDTNNIVLQAVVRLGDPGDCTAGRNIDNNEHGDNISEDSHICTSVSGLGC